MTIFSSLKKRLAKKPSLNVQQQVIRGLVTGKIYDLMEKEKLTKAALAKKLGISKPAVTTLLSGDRNFTVDKITEVAYCMDRTPKIDFVMLNDKQEPNVYSLQSAGNIQFLPQSSGSLAPFPSQVETFSWPMGVRK